MRWLAMSLLLVACGGPEWAPDDLAANVAGPGAIDCGPLDSGSDGDAALLAGHDCVTAALGAGQPFYVVLDQGVADGRDAMAFASDGERIVHIDYRSSYGPIGPVSEQVEAWSCSALLSRGRSCDEVREDLCLSCLELLPLDLDPYRGGP